MSVLQVTSTSPLLASDSTRQWFKAALLTAAIFSIFMMLASLGIASDGTEFEASATQFEEWVTGNLGKLAALAALAVGSVVAAVRKDWSWFFGAMVLSIGIGILVGIINASFTATI